MGPARFHCATLLVHVSYYTNISIYIRISISVCNLRLSDAIQINVYSEGRERSFTWSTTAYIPCFAPFFIMYLYMYQWLVVCDVDKDYVVFNVDHLFVMYKVFRTAHTIGRNRHCFSLLDLYGPKLYRGLMWTNSIISLKLFRNLKKIFFSRARFRSSDLLVMGPARFHCATLLMSGCIDKPTCIYIHETCCISM